MEALFRKIQRWATFISRCFHRSSRKDRLIEIVRDSIETGIWFQCLQDLDNWSDWQRFAALELLVAAVGQDDVLDHSFPALFPQVENLTQASHDFVTQLRTICDSALYAYLSMIVDTAGKRNYLDLSTAVAASAGDRSNLGSNWYRFLDSLHNLKVLDINPAVFQPRLTGHTSLRRPHFAEPYSPLVLLVTADSISPLSHYFKRFRLDLERSREFYYEYSRWHAIVATRYMRFLRRPSNSR